MNFARPILRPLPPGYGAAQKIMPEWRVGYLTYRGGIPHSRLSSVTGGGDVTARSYGPPPPPYIVPNTSALTSVTGGGAVVRNAAALIALSGGAVGNGI